MMRCSAARAEQQGRPPAPVSRNVSAVRGGRDPAFSTKLCPVSGAPATPGASNRVACAGGETTDHLVTSDEALPPPVVASYWDRTVARTTSLALGLTLAAELACSAQRAGAGREERRRQNCFGRECFGRQIVWAIVPGEVKFKAGQRFLITR